MILTMGDRPEALERAIASVRAQRDVNAQVILVANGTGVPPATGAEIEVEIEIEIETNVGIPEGRNVGRRAATAELLFFLDDDGELLGNDLVAEVVAAFAADPRLGAIGLGIVDEEGRTTHRHHPRLFGRRRGAATSFPGAGCIFRAVAFDQAGGWCGDFFYALEETDLAWRLIDDGWDVSFRPDLAIRHPRTSPSRHPTFIEGTARNRVWMAHRLLPAPIAVAYVLNWTAVTVARNVRRPRAILGHLSATMAGLRRPVGPRRPMRWRTVWELTRRGRPPLI